MQTQRTLSLPVIPLLTLVLGLTAGSVLHSQPVVIPNQTHPSFTSTDLDPAIAEAESSFSQNGWEGLTDRSVQTLEEAWEAGVLSAIDAEVMANTNNDFYNANPEYKHYIRSMLEIQAAEQKAAWMHAANQTRDPARQEFIAGLSEEIRRTIERDRATAVRVYDDLGDNSMPTYSRSYDEWKREFQGDYTNGLFQFQTAQNALDQQMAEYDNTLAATDAEFQTNLTRINDAEGTVRQGISDSLVNMRNSLATSEFFYEETCAGAKCTVDTSRLNASGLELQTLINNIQNGLDNDAPLSALSQQMVDYLERQEQRAIDRKNYWDSQSRGDINYDRIAATPAHNSGISYNPHLHGTSVMLSTWRKGVGEIQKNNALATYAADNNNTLAAFYAMNEDIRVIRDYYNSGNRAGLDTFLVNSTGSNQDTRRIETLNNVDIHAMNSTMQTRILIHGFTGAFGWDVANGGSYSSRRDGMFRRTVRVQNHVAYYSDGEIYTGKRCVTRKSGNFCEPSAETVTYEYHQDILNMGSRSTISARWVDDTAVANAARWQTYANELTGLLGHWRDDILPAIQTWEVQAAEYRNSYATWQTNAAADRAAVFADYETARTNLAASRNRWMGRVAEEQRRGTNDWLRRAALASDPDPNPSRVNSSGGTTASAAINAGERANIAWARSNRPPRPLPISPGPACPTSTCWTE